MNLPAYNPEPVAAVDYVGFRLYDETERHIALYLRLKIPGVCVHSDEFGIPAPCLLWSLAVLDKLRAKTLVDGAYEAVLGLIADVRFELDTRAAA